MDELIRERLERADLRDLGPVLQWALDDPTALLAYRLEAVEILKGRLAQVLQEEGGRGEALNVQDRLGHTLMHWIVTAEFWRGRDVNTIQGALEEAFPLFDLDIRNGRGQTPLICATIFDRPRAVECLLRYGADPSILDNINKDALTYAIENEYGEIVGLLNGAGGGRAN